MTQLTTIDTNNFDAMAKAMGIAAEASSGGNSSTLARMRISHVPIMGQTEVNGKMVNMEVVEGGTYRLDIPDGATFFANSVKIRPYMQRFMLKRFIKGTDKTPNRFVKTLMNNDLDVDLKDNDGGFNCGKPAGYIKDFKALPEKMQSLIKEIKRVRAVFGTVELINPVNDKGEDVQLDETPFIWEIDNRDAFKSMGDVFSKLLKMKRLPVYHNVTATTQERKLPNGSVFYLPSFSLDITNTMSVTDTEHDMFANFVEWVDNHNSYISNAWSEKANSKMEDEDVDMVDDLVDIEIEEEEVA